MLSIERIKAKGSTIKAKRLQFCKKLEDLQNALRDAVAGIAVYARSKNSNLELLGPDDVIYGYLSFDKGELTVAYRTTEDDFNDSMDGTPAQYRSYNIKDLAVCPIEWLEKLSSERSIQFSYGRAGVSIRCYRGGHNRVGKFS